MNDLPKASVAGTLVVTYYDGWRLFMMKTTFFLSLFLFTCFPAFAKPLSSEQLHLLQQSFCKKINGKLKINGVAPYAWELSTLMQVTAHDASLRFARAFNTTLGLSQGNSKYKEDHKKNLELQKKFIKEFFYEEVGSTKLEDNHFKKSIEGDISDKQNPIFIFKKDTFKLTCKILLEEKATPCDFATMTVEDESGKKPLCVE